ncbi:aspartate aminotransferase family protein [Rarobacter incanus]|uniref:Taurine--2-oxoglutarate transaminase n=1 Tax=Rarobacter incanus TaxID=153494 RepID=A0A542SR03_9MICO|nr:aspartate aminotransferase family protein [Rarobacter incanus]TQK77043.1 taurine--2-oxoglutarate transaminase [Rarobacter incanus]
MSTSTTNSLSLSDEAVIAADHARVFHSWSAQAHLPNFTVDSGQGCHLWDQSGRRWLDFTSQLVNVNIGYQHPAVVAAIKAQADILTTIAPATANGQRATAAELILRHLPDSFEKVFFTNAGADANENAIRLARLYTGRDKIISHYRSYHGNTGAAINATGDWRRMPNEYSRGHVHVFGPYLYRTEFWATTPEQECERALHSLERTIQSEGPDTVAGILFESIPGTAGILTPPPGYLAGVRRLADKYGIVLILDEVMAGFGRTGNWFAFQAHDVVPDLVTFAKGVNSGYVPAGGVALSGPIAHAFDDRVFPGGLTYSGHPLAMAAIVATITAMEDERIVENAARIGSEVIAPALTDLAASNPLVGEVRGSGVFWAIELVRDRVTREPVTPATMAAIKAACFDRGLLVFLADNRIHIVPPCVVTDDEATQGLAIIADVLSQLSKES